MSFKKAVKATDCISDCYREGLHALKHSDRSYICIQNPRSCNGSVYLDNCLLNSHTADNRWDYTIGIGNRAFFIEIHPAETSEVDVMIRKLLWLKNWLAGDGHRLNAIRANPSFFWVASGRFNIAKTSRQYRLLAQQQLLPRSQFTV